MSCGIGKDVAAFIFGDLVMAFHPVKGDVMFVVDIEESFPEVRIFFVFEVFGLPRENPTFLYGIYDIFGVGVDVDC